MRNFKRAAFLATFLVLTIVADLTLNFLLIPYSYVRVDLHNMRTKQYEDVFVGTSHGLAAIHPDTVTAITGRPGLNLCLGGEYLRDSYYLLKEMLRHQTPSRVVYELDPSYWMVNPVQDFEYGRIFHELPASSVKWEYFWVKMADADFRTTLFPWFNYRNQADKMSANVKIKLSDNYRNFSTAPFIQGNQYFLENGGVYINRNNNPIKADYSLPQWVDSQVVKVQLTYFQKLRKLCYDNGIQLSVITTPIPYQMQEDEKAFFDPAYAYIEDLMAGYGVTYYNFNTIDIGLNRALTDFSDQEGHMFGDSAEEFSLVLGEYLKSPAIPEAEAETGVETEAE